MGPDNTATDPPEIQYNLKAESLNKASNKRILELESLITKICKRKKNFYLIIWSTEPKHCYKPGFRIRHILTSGSGYFGCGFTWKCIKIKNVKVVNWTTTLLFKRVLELWKHISKTVQKSYETFYCVLTEPNLCYKLDHKSYAS